RNKTELLFVLHQDRLHPPNRSRIPPPHRTTRTASRPAVPVPHPRLRCVSTQRQSPHSIKISRGDLCRLVGLNGTSPHSIKISRGDLCRMVGGRADAASRPDSLGPGTQATGNERVEALNAEKEDLSR